MESALSFRFRLVAYFVFLSLLPLSAATWAFGDSAARNETSRVDARLRADLHTAVGLVDRRLDGAAATARELAREPAVKRAFARRDRKALARRARARPNVTFLLGRRRVAGPPPAGAPRRAVDVVQRGRRIGRIVVAVPLRSDVLADVRRDARLAASERLLRLRAGDLRGGGPADVVVQGTTYRAVATPIGGDEGGDDLAVAVPRSQLDSAIAHAKRRLLFAALAAVVLVAALAYLVGRSIVASLRRVMHAAAGIAAGRFEERVPIRGTDEFALLGVAFNDMAAQLETRLAELAAERARTREALARFGEAMAVAHDPEMLLPLIVEGALEATGARRAALLLGGEEVAAAGENGELGQSVHLPLVLGDGRRLLLVLYSVPGHEFDEAEREAARTLVAQGATALENARLQQIVQDQAVTDELTGLANRRRFMESLGAEVSRADRADSPLALVIVDLDDFKQVNDTHGHAAGDEVLRLVGDVLSQSVRQIDLAARYGGEEFALILPGTDLEGAEHLAERVRRMLRAREVVANGSRVAISASFGVAGYRLGTSVEDLLTRADSALYEAKAAGKDRVGLARR